MKKYISNKNYWKPIALFLTMFIAIAFTSCENEDENAGGGPITISKVYLQDVNSDVQDREVSFARLGQLIRIEGSGFLGLKQVLINGYSTYFNPVYLSNTSMLIRVSGDTPTIEAEDDVRNTIRFINSNVDEANVGDNIHGNIFEALVGAIYLDKGFNKSDLTKIKQDYCSWDYFN